MQASELPDPTTVRYPAYYNIAFTDEGVDPHNLATPLPAREVCRYPWVSDQGDGTYKNPILFADYSDPDVCRAGDDFFMTASSFSCVPGLPILHSKDLVNWKLIGHAFHRYPNDDFNIPRHGCGIWAPAIRYHNGELIIHVGDPDNGIYMTKTRDPFANKWEPMHLVRGSRGWIDTAAFWDDDGQAYLVHAFSRSRTGFRNILHLHKMSPDGKTLLDDGVQIFDARGEGWKTGIAPEAARPIYTVIEGPKLYKRNGYYYIFAPGGGVSSGYQVVLRSRNIYGPYEHRIVMDRGTTPINGPHQGAWIDTPDGKEHWFVHFQEVVPYGRVVHLQPMKWMEDWPVIGEVAGNPQRGQPVLRHKKPSVGENYPIELIADSDDFDGPTLAPQWQWWANSKPEWYSLTARPGHLRLCPVSFKEDVLFYNRPNLVCQKFPAEVFTATAKLNVSTLAPGESAGLVLAGKTAATIYAQVMPDGVTLTRTSFNLFDPALNKDTTEATAMLPASAATAIFLRLNVEAKALCTLLYSTDGKSFTPLGKPITASHAMWIGAKVGLFANAPVGAAPRGYSDVDWIQFESS